MNPSDYIVLYIIYIYLQDVSRFEIFGDGFIYITEHYGYYGQDGGAARGQCFMHFGLSADCPNGWRDLFPKHKP